MNTITEIQQLKNIFNDHIYSIIKYGFGKRNLLVVLNNPNIEYLTKISPYVRKLRKEKNIFILSKKNILHKSIGLDFLNIKLTSVTIYGNDIFKDSEIDNNTIKKQIKYESNRILINLRNDFLSCRWSWNKKKLLFSTLPSILPLIVGCLYLKGEKIPNAIPDTINKYIKYNKDAEVLLKIRKNISNEEMLLLFNQIFYFLENMSDKV